MGKVAKKTGIEKAVVRPLKTGDFLIHRRDGRVLRVGPVTKRGFETESRWGGEWSNYGSREWNTGWEHEYIKLEKPIEEYEADLLRELTTDFATYRDGPASNSTEVAITSGSDQAKSVKAALEKTTRDLALFHALMERKKDQLYSLQRHYKEQLDKVSRVVDIIELYLGISEEIVQIAEGEPAPESEPVSIRQLVLHMDEEAADLYTGATSEGVHTDDIDFQNIELFDDWARKHYALLIPEEKGVVVCRPRRTAKDYQLGDDPMAAMISAAMNNENFRTYYLLRNGKSLYRISSDKIHVYPVLFPSETEFKEISTPEEDGEFTKEQQAKTMGYQRNVLMLQGLIDRTNVFKPMPAGLVLMNPETYEGRVRFIRDAESLLSDGKPEFWTWLKSINAKTKRGDRLYFNGFEWGEFSGDRGRQDAESLRMRFPIPGWTHRPHKGVYNVVRVEPYSRYYRSEAEESFVCQHKPTDTVYKRPTRYRDSEESERKMSVPFRLFPDDRMIVNYEHLKREDVEFYLKDRVNRQHYLKMVPLLRGLLKAKDEEKEWENNFVEFVVGRTGASPDLVRSGVLWWKTKVIEKRPLKKEDAKALRMIEDWIKRQSK